MTSSHDSAQWTASDLIDGIITDPGRAREVIEPASGRVCGQLGYGTPADASRRANAAADAASRALPSWAATAPRARADILLRAAELVGERTSELAHILAVEAGKRVPEATGEIGFSREYLRWFAEQIRNPCGDVFTAEHPSRFQLSLRRPLGVVACLTPWNFPVSILARKVAPALAAGCTVLVRVSEKAPLAATRWLEALIDAGLPHGVVNLVHGDPVAISRTWLDHPSVRGVSFTGSTRVGAEIMGAASRRIVRPMLELGGNAPFIVLDDADLETALEQAELGKLRNTGQSCIGINRFLVQHSIADEFSSRLAARFDQLTIGPGTADPVPDVGPVIDVERVTAVTSIVDEAIAAGGRRLTAERELPSEGYWVAPTLIADAPLSTPLATEEVFGPAAGIFTFETDAEAVQLANSTEMGLAAYVNTQNAKRALQFAGQLDAGIIGINDSLPSVAFAPLGGTRQSGLGREGAVDGLREFQETAYIAWRP